MNLNGTDIKTSSAFAFYLREKREACGLTVLDLSNKLGISAQDLFDIEKKSSSVSLKLLSDLSRCLQIPPAELLYRLPATLPTQEPDGIRAKKELFRAGAIRVAALANRAGAKVDPFVSASLPHFCALPLAHQSQVLKSLALKEQILISWLNGGDSRSPQRLLWATLSGLGLKPPAELFQHLNPRAILEIYNLENFQIWRDLNMLCATSYTLEELYCLDGFNRFHRAPEDQKLAMETVASLLAVPKAHLQILDVPDFVIQESQSREGLVFRIRHDLICSLTDREGKLAGWLVTSEVKAGGWIDTLLQSAAV